MEPEPWIAQAVADFQRLRHVLAEEREFAVTVIRGLLEMQTVPSRPHSQSWISVGMVIELERTVPRMVNEMPEQSTQLAHLATVIASALDETYPPVMRAECTAAAWRLVANVRRRDNQLESALAALDVAGRALEPQGGSVHDNAVLALARATLYVDLRRPLEARRRLNAARGVFDTLGDNRRLGQCELLAGIMSHGEGELARAGVAYQRALAAARAAGDADGEAMADLNIAVAETERGAPAAAVQALRRAVVILKGLDRRFEMARANRVVALALRTAGRFDTAIPLFRQARGAFLSFGRIEEATLAGLGLAETYLAVGRRAAATRLIAAITEELREAKLDEHVRDALGNFPDPGAEVSTEAVRKAHAYLADLRPDPRVPFP